MQGFKFKAWHKEKKRFYEVWALDFEAEGAVNLNNDGDSFWVTADEVILVQERDN